MAPPPITRTWHSGTGRTSERMAVLIACTAVAAGSVSAAARDDIPSGSSITLDDAVVLGAVWKGKPSSPKAKENEPEPAPPNPIGK